MRPWLVTHDNQTHTLQEWSSITGLTVVTIYHRLRKGMPVADALDITYCRKSRKTRKNPAIVQAAAGAGVSYRVAHWRMGHNGDMHLRHAPVVVSCCGTTLTLAGWARRLGISRQAVHQAHRRGSLTGIIEKRDGQNAPLVGLGVAAKEQPSQSLPSEQDTK